MCRLDPGPSRASAHSDPTSLRHRWTFLPKRLHPASVPTCRRVIRQGLTFVPESATDGPQLGEALAPYAERAMDEAIEAGLTPTELRAVLQGTSVAELIPPYPSEGLAAYADLATSELLTRYLAQNAIDPL